MQKVSIRYARPGDLNTIIRMSRRGIWRTWWAGNFTHGRNHVVERIKQRRTIVAMLDGGMVGYAMYGVIWNTMHLENVFVEQRHRRAGIGTDLFEELERIGKRKRYKKMMSDCDVTNAASIKYHLRNGFRRSGYIKNLWDRTDSVVFSKPL